jgi:hypothetical protein
MCRIGLGLKRLPVRRSLFQTEVRTLIPRSHNAGSGGWEQVEMG